MRADSKSSRLSSRSKQASSLVLEKKCGRSPPLPLKEALAELEPEPAAEAPSSEEKCPEDAALLVVTMPMSDVERSRKGLPSLDWRRRRCSSSSSSSRANSPWSVCMRSSSSSATSLGDSLLPLEGWPPLRAPLRRCLRDWKGSDQMGKKALGSSPSGVKSG